MPRYLDDFRPGETFESPSFSVTEDAIVRFAREFDPQPMHLDRAAAAGAAFGRLVASGWHTAALTMRLVTQAGLDLSGGIVGGGAEELRWPQPLLPGDVIHVRITILDVRGSRSKPDRGVVRARIETLREDGAPVQQMIVAMIVPRGPNVSAPTAPAGRDAVS